MYTLVTLLVDIVSEIVDKLKVDVLRVDINVNNVPSVIIVGM
jgi:hypothetical protein